MGDAPTAAHGHARVLAHNEAQPPAWLRPSSIRTVTVGPGVSPESALRLAGLALMCLTADREFHPALKVCLVFSCLLKYISRENNCQGIIANHFMKISAQSAEIF